MSRVLTIREVVYLAEKAAVEAYNAVKEGGGSDADAHAAAGDAFRDGFPTLSSRPAVLAYLALAVRGIEQRLVTHHEARLMVMTARTWLQASQPAKVVSQ